VAAMTTVLKSGFWRWYELAMGWLAIAFFVIAIGAGVAGVAYHDAARFGRQQIIDILCSIWCVLNRIHARMYMRDNQQ
jgi:hypothetical protein